MDDAALIERYIEPNPNKHGKANAWLRDYGIAVWALVGYWMAVKGDVDQVAADYGLPLEAVQAALAYYRRYKCLIDDRLGLEDD